MKTNKIGMNEALKAALAYAGLSADDARCTFASHHDGLYELTVRTSFQKYDFYVEAWTGEVLGINAEPMLDLDEEGSRMRRLMAG